ncbi:SDR family NAD(P)-dependent oxidoreductase (plasmid) [Streptomyces sp. BHT-5-2]|uniref:SDR family NAD(P)-dependent oxidoreductase n=1 Tax=Streptomyces sp. BHT-5-2 TaxID=2866715 RepID=UPI001C8E40D0|nr:SDR family NAD(P)-dependent oxidoreductase [Streptomyces sp. BHT-5-2]QZL07783.1 SDR family NAD(P)-dependent oxidoreductase [Streptomyces sp. BHT-5-2]
MTDRADTTRPPEPAVPGLARDQHVAVVGMGLVVPGADTPERFWALLQSDDTALTAPTRFRAAPLTASRTPGEHSTGTRAGFVRTFAPHPVLAAERSAGDLDDVPDETLWLRHSALHALNGVTVRPDDRVTHAFGAWSHSTQAMEDTLVAEGIADLMAQECADGRFARLAAHHRHRGRLGAHFRHARRRPAEALPHTVLARALEGLTPDPRDTFLVDAASASSLYALQLVWEQLRAGATDVALVGGFNNVGRLGMTQLTAFHGMSASGRLRAYDRAADGTLFAEAAAVLVLKPLGRAIADRDPVHAVVGAVATAGDGRGTHVAVPNPRGQTRALTAALTTAGLTVDDLARVVGHGGGSPVGDRTERAVLTELWQDAPLECTSNKPHIGHPSWAAGAVSVIHAVLAVQHRRPSAASPPGPARPRAAAGVTAIGLGGANAHAVVCARHHAPAQDRSRPPLPTGLVVVAWSAVLPGHPDRRRIGHLLRTGTARRTYSAADLDLPFDITRLPPALQPSLDPHQLLALDAAHALVAAAGELWAAHRGTTGVIAALPLPSPRLAAVTLRSALPELGELPWKGRDFDAWARVRAHLRETPVSEETMAGLVPGVAAGRVANRWDLRGPSMALTGPEAGRAALAAAAALLAAGRLDIALVLGTALGTGPLSAALAETPPDALREGTFLLAVTTADLAAHTGLPVLGTLNDPANTPTWTTTRTDRPTAYFGIDPLADTVARLAAPAEPPAEPRADPSAAVAPTAPPRRPEDDEMPGTLPLPVNAQPPHLGRTGPAAPAATLRTALVLRRSALPPADHGPDRVGALPPGCLVLTNSHALAATVAPRCRARRALLVSTDDTDGAPPDGARRWTGPPDGAALAGERLAALRPHVRVLVDVRPETTPWPGPAPTALTRLHDALLTALKGFGPRMADGSLAVVVHDALTAGLGHPHGALLTGMVRSLAWELPRRHTLALVTDAAPRQALSQLATELAADRDRPVVHYSNGTRLTEHLLAAPLPADRETGSPLTADSVLVAAGGARGITATILRDLAARHRPTIWLLGTTPIDGIGDDLALAAPEAEGTLRRAHIARAVSARPPRSVAAANREFTALWQGREVVANLRRLRALCGADRVHYLRCDITDAAATARAARTVLAHHPRIDLLIHAATRSRPALLAAKTLQDVHHVLDTKVGGYLNLKAAFAPSPPALWCNFGSDVPLFGFPGDLDYVAANAFLGAAARYDSALGTGREITIGWGLWTESGFAAGELERERTRRFGLATGLTDAEGTAAFRSEIADPRTLEAHPLWTSPSERALAERHSPGITAALHPDPPASRTLLGAPDRQGADHAEWTWTLDPHRDTYLLDHTLDQRPVLAGTLFLALAAEAAGALAPGAPPTTLENARFHEYVWADPTHPGPTKYRITARRSGPTRIQVAMLSDITAPDGKTLVKDRRHAGVDIRTPNATATAPHPAHGTDGQPPATRLRRLDPTWQSRSPLRLFGPFRNLLDVEQTPTHIHARWHTHLGPHDPYAQLPLPALLLDAMVRTTFFNAGEPEHTHIRVLRGIDRIELPTACSDRELSLRHPEGIPLTCDLATDDCTATTPSGRLVARLTGVDTPAVARIASPPVRTPRTPR